MTEIYFGHEITIGFKNAMLRIKYYQKEYFPVKSQFMNFKQIHF